MKTKIFFFLFAVTLISFAIVVTMCKKRDNEISTQQPAKHELSQRDKKVLSLVENFKANLNSKLKDGEEISIDSAIWYIESTMNIYYARNDNVIQSFTDSTFVTIPLRPNNLVRMSDVDAAYQALIDSLTVHYQKIEFDEEKVLFADISVTQNHDDYIVVKMLDVIGNYFPYVPFTFGATDYWIWGYSLGKCGNYSGQGIGNDAASELYQYANLNHLHGAAWTDIITKGPYNFTEPAFYTGPDPNPFGYYQSLLFGDGGDGITNLEYDECLQPNEMNYYLTGLMTAGLIVQTDPNFGVPSYDNLIWYFCNWEIGYPAPPAWGHDHVAYFTFGHQVSVPFPPIILQN